jgi:hypothetical protein
MSPFEKLRHLSADLADKGNTAVQALSVSPELACGALRTWLEAGVIQYLERANKLPTLIGADNSLERRIDRLFDRSIISQQQRSQFHKIRMDGNAAAHGSAVDTTTVNSNFRYGGAIGDWLLQYEPPQSTPQPTQTAQPVPGAPSPFEQFFNFRKYRALGLTKW